MQILSLIDDTHGVTHLGEQKKIPMHCAAHEKATLTANSEKTAKQIYQLTHL